MDGVVDLPMERVGRGSPGVLEPRSLVEALGFGATVTQNKIRLLTLLWVNFYDRLYRFLDLSGNLA